MGWGGGGWKGHQASGDSGISHLSERRSGWLRSQAALSESDRPHSQPPFLSAGRGRRRFVPLLPREQNLLPGAEPDPPPPLLSV